MVTSRADRRFFSTTRGRVVQLLRRASRTVEELAQALGLTDNAVRAHLATLERDGLVRQGGLRRGPGKPSYTYDLTPESERLFPKPYGPVLRQLLDVLGERLGPRELEAALREVGRRLGSAFKVDGDPAHRLEAAVAALDELGGLAELEERDGRPLIIGFSCPLAAAVPGHPEVCRLAEALVQEIVGAPVRECCERAEPPRCRFEVDIAPAYQQSGGSPSPT
jgi:predicted ArsR family transcriptional regulator